MLGDARPGALGLADCTAVGFFPESFPSSAKSELAGKTPIANAAMLAMALVKR
jgi:hypothetical protein